MTIGDIAIKFEFESIKTDDNKIKYSVHCRTYRNGKVTHDNKVADVLRELGVGLFVYPLVKDVQKQVRDAFVKRSNAELKTKAKWTDNGFLYKESQDG